MIAVVDYDTGNLRSVAEALRRAGAEFRLTADQRLLREAERVILPGVGEASSAMQRLRERGLDRVIPSLAQPVLGICIGMQLMCLSSEEGRHPLHGHLPGTGAATARRRAGRRTDQGPPRGLGHALRLRSPLFDGLDEGAYVYYVHSFAAEPCAETVAVTDYGGPFSAALACGNFFGVQFHPEKSGETGARILRNFLNMK